MTGPMSKKSIGPAPQPQKFARGKSELRGSGGSCCDFKEIKQKLFTGRRPLSQCYGDNANEHKENVYYNEEQYGPRHVEGKPKFPKQDSKKSLTRGERRSVRSYFCAIQEPEDQPDTTRPNFQSMMVPSTTPKPAKPRQPKMTFPEGGAASYIFAQRKRNRSQCVVDSKSTKKIVKPCYDDTGSTCEYKMDPRKMLVKRSEEISALKRRVTSIKEEISLSKAGFDCTKADVAQNPDSEYFSFGTG